MTLHPPTSWSLQQLEQATACREDSEATYDSQTSELRDCWNEFSNLLSAADATREPLAVHVELPHRSNWPQRLAAMAAAAALVAGFVAWGARSTSTVAPQIAAGAAASALTGPIATASVSALPWDDDLDRDLQSLQSQYWTPTVSSHTDDSLRHLARQFEQISEELFGDTL